MLTDDLESLSDSGNICLRLVQYYVGDAFYFQGCEIELVSAWLFREQTAAAPGSDGVAL